VNIFPVLSRAAPPPGVTGAAYGERLTLCTAALLVFGTFAIVLICDLAFILGFALTPVLARFALLVGPGAALAAVYRIDRAMVLPAIVATGIVVLLSMLGTRLQYDATADGIYHLSAIDALIRGWNPVWHSYVEYRRPGEEMEFIEVYGKAGWVLTAAQMQAGLGAEAAKCSALYLPAAALLALYGIGRRLGLATGWALAIALAAAFNPVVLQEFWTRMNDGQMTSLVAIFVAGQLLWTLRRDTIGLALALPAMALALNFKISGAPIFVVLCAFAVFAEFRVRGWRPGIHTAGLLMGAGLFAIVVIGASPYVRAPLTGIVTQDVPLTQQGWAGMMEGDWPNGFEAMPGWERWTMSFFAAADYVEVRAKVPFTFTRQELLNAGDAEVMVGGLGPLFSGAMLLAVALAAWGLVATRSRPRDPARAALGIMAVGIAAASILMPQSWYFRYVPHLWLVPIALALAAGIDGGWRRAGTAAVLAVMLLNSALVGMSSLIEADLIPARALWARSYFEPLPSEIPQRDKSAT